jgi:hypothetical protein
LDRYHPVSSTTNHNDSSFRSIGSASNQSFGIIPGKKPSSPKPDDINVKDSAWQAQLSESGVFAGWEHAQEAGKFNPMNQCLFICKLLLIFG